ncbi:MAG: hypothetical protein K2J01_06710 [Clostridiales bacterium]|nr:hypothetical protein [Clostridiales bacterium]
MTKKQVKNSYLCVLLMLLLLVLMLVSGWFISPAFADTERYTGVLDDLHKDSTFSVDEWIDKSKHKVTEVMQIAISSDKELFIYVHQVGDIRDFTYVVMNIALFSTELDFKSYELEKVDWNGKFFKYKVIDFKVADSDIQKYCISRLDYPVDSKPNGSQVVTYDSVSIGQIWTVTQINDKYEYSYTYFDTIVVMDKFVGFDYSTVLPIGWAGYKSQTNTFYIAFDTDIKMSNLLEAQIEYKQSYIDGSNVSGVKNVVVQCDNEISYSRDVYKHWLVDWPAGTEFKSYKAISTPAEFSKNFGITVPKKENGKDYEWVVVFYNETKTSGYPGNIKMWTLKPLDTTILRLKFEKDGVTYNLGTIDNRVSAIIPKPEPWKSISFWQYIWNCIVKLFNGTANFVETVVAVAAIFVAVALLPILLFVFSLLSPSFGAIMKSILKSIGKALSWLLKGLWWLITAPFRLIVHLIAGGKS